MLEYDSSLCLNASGAPELARVEGICEVNEHMSIK